MIKVYIAGPITKPDPKKNAILAIKYADQLLNLGYAPFLPQLCVFWQEHGEHRDDGSYGAGYETWMNWAFEWIRQCNVLLRIPGESLGADREVAFAQSLRIQVCFSIKDLLKKFPPVK